MQIDFQMISCWIRLQHWLRQIFQDPISIIEPYLVNLHFIMFKAKRQCIIVLNSQLRFRMFDYALFQFQYVDDLIDAHLK